MDTTNIYLVKHDSLEIPKNTLVRYITCTYSGECYLVEELNGSNRAWIMKYDLYAVDKNNNDYKYSENFQQIVDSIL